MIAALQSLPEPLPTVIAYLLGAAAGVAVWVVWGAVAAWIGRRR